MATIFFDTSALVRRYDRSEPGGAQVRRVCSPSAGHTLLVARLASLEVASALNRKVRLGQLTREDVARLWRVFRGHWRSQYRQLAVAEPVLVQAEQLLFHHPLRTIDALQLACAMAASTILSTGVQFWTADQHQARAASAEALAVTLVA